MIGRDMAEGFIDGSDLGMGQNIRVAFGFRPRPNHPDQSSSPLARVRSKSVLVS